MEMTRYRHISPSDQMLEKPAPPLEIPVPDGGVRISLPSSKLITVEDIDLRTSIEKRRTTRRYAAESLTLEELAYLLWCTQGICEVHQPYYTLRTVPSAGGRHSFETYLLLNRVDGVDPGLYRYLAFSHELFLISDREGIMNEVMTGCLDQPFIRSSAVTFIWVCDVYRMAWRYSERAYRLVHLDAGHVCQNLYLASGQIRCGTCAIAAFDDEIMALTLGIDGVSQFVIYCATVGKKESDW